MAKAKSKKSKGFLAAAGSLLGSIPAVGSVKNAVKKVKQTTKKKKQLAASLKKAVKKAKKKAKKKIGKVFTQARKLMNNLSLKQLVNKLKKNMKKVVLAVKKVEKKVKTIVNKSTKIILITKKNMKIILLEENYCTVDSQSQKNTIYNIMKSWNSIKEIGTDFWGEVTKRNDNKFNSLYDFFNYSTFGVPEGIVLGQLDRSKKMFDSPADFFNYGSGGMTGMITGAFAPEDPYSKEHLQNSFGVATMVAGVGGRVLSASGAVRIPSTKKPGDSNGPPKADAENTKKTETETVETKGTVNNGSTIKNKFPDEELPKDGKILSYSLKDGKIKGIDGRTEVDFVIDKNGNLVIGKRHHTLGNKDEVLAAGQLKINGQGEVRRITNESGHYRPTPKEAMDYPQLIKDAGVNVKGAWIEFYSYKIDADGFIIDSTKVVSKKLTE